VEKHSSHSKNKNNLSKREPGKVSPLPREPRREKDTEPEATNGNMQQDELQKDLELLAKLREQIDQLPEIDAARIVQLHERILRGEYRVDSDSLAKKLRKFESDF